MSVVTLFRGVALSNQTLNNLTAFYKNPFILNSIRNVIQRRNINWLTSRHPGHQLHSLYSRNVLCSVDQTCTRHSLFPSAFNLVVRNYILHNQFHTGTRLFVNRPVRQNIKFPNSNTNQTNGRNKRNVHNSKETSSTKENGAKETSTNNETIVQKFKRVYKEHGYVLIGVHLVTSALWFGSFFAIVQGGVDIVALLEKLGFSEKILKPFKSSSAGNIAVAYLMYKLATPARYTVTLTGTALSIRFLRRLGWMKDDKIIHVTKQAGKYGRNELKVRRGRIGARIKKPVSKARVRMRTSFRKFSDRIKHGQQNLKSRLLRIEQSVKKRHTLLKKSRSRRKNTKNKE